MCHKSFVTSVVTRLPQAESSFYQKAFLLGGKRGSLRQQLKTEGNTHDGKASKQWACTKAENSEDKEMWPYQLNETNLMGKNKTDWRNRFENSEHENYNQGGKIGL